MKKVLAGLLTVGLLVGLVTAAYASVGTTSTSIILQNLSTSDAAVQVDFYNTLGNNTGSKSETLAGETSMTFDQRFDSGDPGEDPFQGAAIVSADQSVGAVVQMVRTGGAAGVNSYESYNGVMDAAEVVKAPLILRGIPSAGKTWNTTMAIQNTSTTNAADVTVTFTPVGLGNADEESFTLPAGGSQYIMQSEQTALGAQFFGSAAVEADENVAVVVTSEATDGSALIVYPTYTEGSLELNLPGAMKNILSLGDNYFTSLTIVNLGEAGDPSPVVTLEYQAELGEVGAPYDVTVETATTIDQRFDDAITSETFFGAIKLSNTENSTPFAAMLNTRGDDPNTGEAVFATTYSGLSSGVMTAYTPYLLKYIPSAGYNWSTSILLQNLSTTEDLDVTITYVAADETTYTSNWSDIETSQTVDLRFDPGLTPDTFFGGAKIESTNGAPFAAIVLVRGSGGAGDALSSYLGISP